MYKLEEELPKKDFRKYMWHIIKLTINAQTAQVHKQFTGVSERPHVALV